MERRFRILTLLGIWICLVSQTVGNPHSKPYVPFVTSPHEEGAKVPLDAFVWNSRVQTINYLNLDSMEEKDQCPLQFTLGVAERTPWHDNRPGQGIVEPPIIETVFPSSQGKQIVYTTHWEHLHVLTTTAGSPVNDEETLVHPSLHPALEFPLLLESSAFSGSGPIVADVNGDGRLEAILADYDGGLYIVGLSNNAAGNRYWHHAQVPRLFVRKDWVGARLNETKGILHPNQVPEPDTSNDTEPHGFAQEKPFDPYHSYFEYSYGTSNIDTEEKLQGVSAHLLHQNPEQIQNYHQRKARRGGSSRKDDGVEVSSEDGGEATEGRRRLSEVVDESELQEVEHQATDPDTPNDYENREPDVIQDWYDDLVNAETGGDDRVYYGDDAAGMKSADLGENPDESYYGDDEYSYRHYGDDMMRPRDDDAAPKYDDYRQYDDYYGRYDSEHKSYYDEMNYVRLPPHVLCTPVLAELPRMYGKEGETDDMIFMAVSYYFDEDEQDGLFSYRRFPKDDPFYLPSETERGQYVASALVVFQLGDAPRWGREEHLDTSTDHSAPLPQAIAVLPESERLADDSRTGAFALSSPTVADIDGDGNLDIILGTSMGYVYAMDARHMYQRSGWPVQMPFGVESRIVVEDVRGDTNLEVFVADIGGNVVCLDHKGETLWHRDLVASLQGRTKHTSYVVHASSPMVLGDVDGDGRLDIVLSLRIQLDGQKETDYLFALVAENGRDLVKFPIRMSSGMAPVLEDDRADPQLGDRVIHQKMPPALLVDLHSDQSFMYDYIHREGRQWTKRDRGQVDGKPGHGGTASGLHIVQPVGSHLVVIEGGSGCAQSISLGEEVLTMVQADDVHGNNHLDLIVTTAKGNVIILETQALPFHPLNTWSHGDARGRQNTFAHGYSASQGIFVHEISRRFRDIFGVYIPVTFEVFDNRPNIAYEPEKRQYHVEIRAGKASSRAIFRRVYNTTGVFTEHVYIPYGPGYYLLNVMLRTTHGLVYEDSFNIGYNVDYMKGFGVLLWLPLVLASICIFMCGTKKPHWDDEDYEGSDGNTGGILGGSRLPE